ncbi:hypothetical protein MKX01_017194 [Papaver californicum]|nr:hypothetical protein MKX01_005188 [Papaver californicum]KAI3997429.1 hypothetical protein MKX01_017194 [Papaver californicum]
MDEDIIVCEILSRLPVKSLMWFKSVCKHWCCLIKQDPHFIDLHFSRSKTRQCLFIVQLQQSIVAGGAGGDIVCRGRQAQFLAAQLSPGERGQGTVTSTILSMSKTNLFSYSSIVGIVNGLICFADHNEHAVCVYNISTRDQITPWIKSALLTEEKLIVEFGGSCVYKFGFDPVGKDYKVIGKWKIGDDFEIWGVLTVGQDTWRKIDEVPPCYIGPSAPSVCVNGFIYWFPNRYTGDDGFIVAFEIGCEKFRTIRIPNFILRPRSDYDGDEINVRLLQVNGSVAILRRMSDCDIKLWIYGNIDKESSKAITIDTGDKNWTENTITLPVVCWDRNRFLYFDTVSGTDQIIFEIHQKNSDALPDSLYFYSYELKSKNFKEIKISGIPSSVPVRDTKAKLCRSFSESLYSFSAAEKKQCVF